MEENSENGKFRQNGKNSVNEKKCTYQMNKTNELGDMYLYEYKLTLHYYNIDTINVW